MSKQKADTKLVDIFTVEELLIVTQCNTRLDAESNPINTRLTLDFSKASLKDLLNWSRQNRIIAWQASRRQSDNIPTTATVVCTGAKQKLTSAEKAMRMINKLSKEEKAKFLEALQS